MSNKIKTLGAAAQESRVAVPQAAQDADGVPAESGRRVLVDCGVLQMVLNALERDALEGGQVRAEMRMELMQSIAHPTQQGLDAQTQAARDVLAERKRQIITKGYEPDSDDGYEHGELAFAAATYAVLATNAPKLNVDHMWPWHLEPKIGTPRRMLVKAGALIQAAIEREDRIAAQAKQGEQANG